METHTKLAAFISSLAFGAHVSIASAQDVTTSTPGKTVVLRRDAGLSAASGGLDHQGGELIFDLPND